jgi:AAA+ ATPase superfamily predicted ATPase
MIGRRKQQKLLHELVNSNGAQFVVVYGRRRVGKTYLVRETFNDDFAFSYTGIANIGTAQQIAEFSRELQRYGWRGNTTENWFDAFEALRELLDGKNDEYGRSRPLIVFLDEMPWMDTHKSNFVPALEHFWNGWASGIKNITLIVCGSATAWITKKIFKNKGGLYNRVTRQIKLEPFTLAECNEFYASRGIAMNVHDMAESYMVFGGIPYYLDMLRRSNSLALNIDELCFAKNAPLKHEFSHLFATLFNKPEKHMQVIKAINSKKRGLTRDEIIQTTKLTDGGNATRLIDELEESGFIRKYKPYGNKSRGSLYQLSDQFTAFHLDFIDGNTNEHYWSASIDNQRHRAWSGYAFEQLCLAHTAQIKNALGISGVLSDESAWHGNGAQIDLVIDRNDQVINLCEMKYYAHPLLVDKRLDKAMRDKAVAFMASTHTHKALHLTLVSIYGMTANAYSQVFQSSVTAEELMAF